MDKTTAKILREKLKDLLPMYGISEDYEITVGRASYDDTQITFKVQIKETGAPSTEEKNLERYAKLHGLDTTKIHDIQGKRMTLVGFNTRATKMPYLAKDMNSGDTYKLSVDSAQRFFKQTEDA